MDSRTIPADPGTSPAMDHVTPSLAQLSAVLELTQKMREAAGREDWPGIAELDESRQPRLQAAFAHPIPAAEADAAAALVRRIQAVNQEIIGLGQSGRARVSEALGQLSAGRRARSAYTRSAR